MYIFKKLYSDRKKKGENYKLTGLVSSLLGPEHTKGAHNELNDVIMLQKLIVTAKLDISYVTKHTRTFYNFLHEKELKKKKKQSQKLFVKPKYI